MIDQTALNADLQALATKHQVHLSGKATPVNPEEDAFDVTAEAQPVAEAGAEGSTEDTAQDSSEASA